ncbi:MAG: YCF48-related protein [Micropepsaceae bacterium]
MKWSKLGPSTALALATALLLSAAVIPNAWSVVPPRNGEAVKSKLAAESLLLDVTRAGKRMVAVGEYGDIVLSDDDGKTWRQAARVPVTLTLTSVAFVDEKNGWAVGHDTVILVTHDAGENWTKQYGGDAKSEAALLSVFFKDAQHGWAIGAFNLTVETSDAGKTWTERKSLMPGHEPPTPKPEDLNADPTAPRVASPGDDPFATTGVDENHMNSMFAGPDANTIFVAAEGGAIYRSGDAGATWKKILTGYVGSFWGGFTGKDGTVFVTGMRGNVWRSTDQGNTFTKMDTAGADQSIAGGTQLVDGSYVFVGLGGQVLYSPDGVKYTLTYRADRKGLNDVIEDGNKLYLFGEAGVLEQSSTPRPEDIEKPVPSGT